MNHWCLTRLKESGGVACEYGEADTEKDVMASRPVLLWRRLMDRLALLSCCAADFQALINSGFYHIEGVSGTVLSGH